MTGWRVYPCSFAAVVLAGCSGIENPTLAPPAEPRTLELGWVERYAAAGFTFRVERLTVGEDGWQAEIESRTAPRARTDSVAAASASSSSTRRAGRRCCG